MDDDEAAAALDEGFQRGTLLRLDVARRLRVDDEHVGLRELNRRGKIHRAVHLHAAFREQHLPVIEKAFVLVGIRTMRLLAATDEDAQRIGLGRGQRDEKKEKEGCGMRRNAS